MNVPPEAPAPPPSTARPASPPVAFAKFVSCVKDKPVTRFLLSARGGTRAGNFFGARREGGVLVYDEEAVIPLTAEEWGAFGREYLRAIRDKHLRERSREEYDAYLALVSKRATEAAEAAAKEVPAEAPEAVTGEQNAKAPELPAGGEKP